MNAYKKTREKHGGDRPCCVVCGEAHRHCVKHWGDI